MNDQNIIKIGIILGSTRQGRFGDKPAQWILERLSGTEGVEAELFDLRDYPMPFFDEAVPPAAEKEYTNEVVQRWTAKVTEKDAFIIVSPEYNHGYSAVVKNALDYVYRGWIGKAVGFVSWGGTGGSRSVEQLRQVVIELQMIPIRIGVHISEPWMLTDDEGQLKDGALEKYEKGAGAMIEQLVSMSRLLKKGRSV